MQPLAEQPDQKWNLEKTPLYKVLGENLSPHHGGRGKWKIGEPRSVTGELVPCKNGLHVVKLDQLLQWIGPRIHPVTTVSDEYIDHGDKFVFRSITIGSELPWNDRTARLFAADCADRAIRQTQKITGKKCHPRLRACTRAARDFAEGKIGTTELSAAQGAAQDAAWYAARGAAWYAARDAAWYAAQGAAQDAAWYAARGAAWYAARDAAWYAARGAAQDAARDAAWYAARGAEVKWQNRRLYEYLTGKRG